MINIDDLLAENTAVFEEEFKVNSCNLVDHVVDPDEDFVLFDGVPLAVERKRRQCKGSTLR